MFKFSLRPREYLRPALVGLVCLILATVFAAFSAQNTVNPTSLLGDERNLTANDYKPDECSGINLTAIVIDADGTSANELILGTGTKDTLRGGGGDDCIVGGSRKDNLYGEGGNDVLLGGANNDHLYGGAGTDICYGGPGNDQYTSCETEY